jgi:hypothetical protein
VKVKDATETALHAVLKPATDARLAVVMMAMDLQTGELDVSTNVKSSSDTLINILLAAWSVVVMNRRTVGPKLESDL